MERIEMSERERISEFRVGGKVPLNVYEGDRPVFQCHTPEDAARFVELLNAARELRELGSQLAEAQKQGERLEECYLTYRDKTIPEYVAELERTHAAERDKLAQELAEAQRERDWDAGRIEELRAQVSERNKWVNCGGVPTGRVCKIDGHAIYGAFFGDPPDGPFICETHAFHEVRAERDKLAGALKTLANEAIGFLSQARTEDHGITNIRVLESKINEARAALRELERK
jgi:hypothetical protein